METFVALLRGINVGRKRALPMKELVAIMVSLGARDVRTYIQSGNAVFQANAGVLADFSGKLTAEIKQRKGYEPHVLILGLDAVEDAMARNPFPQAESEPKSLHLGFLDGEPGAPDLDRLESLRKESESFRLIGAVFYLHAPERVGRSRLAAAAEKLLGVPMTDRNWRTVTKIHELARE